jgi:hypothetical protein
MGVFVVGMHRSGTSALAGALEALGFDAGPVDDLMPADIGNPQGYFELKSIASLNDEILMHYGGSWDCPPLLAEGWERDGAATAFVERARTLLKDVYASQHFVMKDPRASLLLPLWRNATDDRDCAVVIVREPLEVASSLTRRNALPMLTGLALWASYNRSLLAGLQGLRVHVCNYAELIENPTAVLQSVVESLRAWGEIDSDIDVTPASATIQPELRRNAVSRENQAPGIPPQETSELMKFTLGLGGRHDHFDGVDVPGPGWWEGPLLDERRTTLQWAWASIAALEKHNDELATENGVLWERNGIADEQVAHLNARVDHFENAIPTRLYRLLKSPFTKS